jgi:hypothetical protein
MKSLDVGVIVVFLICAGIGAVCFSLEDTEFVNAVPSTFTGYTPIESVATETLERIESKLDTYLTILGNQVNNDTAWTDESFDPNDPIYNLLWKMTPEWQEKFGDSERSRIISNLSSTNGVLIELIKMVNAQAERIKALEEAEENKIKGALQMVAPKIVVDPNEEKK